MKKKILMAFAISACVLCACGNTTTTEAESPAAATPETTVETEAKTDEAESSDVQVVLGADPTAVASESTEGLSVDDVAVVAGNVTIKLDQDFSADIEKVGEAEIVEGQACLDGGYDTNYYYGGEELAVYTIAEAGKQLPYDIYVTGSAYQTKLGATVGTTTKQDIEGMYGTCEEMRGNSYFYSIAGDYGTAQFEFDENDVLKSMDFIKQ